MSKNTTSVKAGKTAPKLAKAAPVKHEGEKSGAKKAPHLAKAAPEEEKAPAKKAGPKLDKKGKASGERAGRSKFEWVEHAEVKGLFTSKNPLRGLHALSVGDLEYLDEDKTTVDDWVAALVKFAAIVAENAGSDDADDLKEENAALHTRIKKLKRRLVAVEGKSEEE